MDVRSFEAEDAAIARVYHCPYHPLHGIGEYRRDHPWRKPKPGMILQAISDLGLDPAQCPILGDKISDMEAGVAAGLGLRILLDARADRGRNHVLGHEVVANLGEALELLRSRFAHAASGSRSRALEGLATPRLNLAVASAITMPRRLPGNTGPVIAAIGDIGIKAI